MTTPLQLDDDELAATSKAVDVHRQSLIRKLSRIAKSNVNERQHTLDEIQACSSASHKMRQVHDASLTSRAS